jgi:hypothetical protein
MTIRLKIGIGTVLAAVALGACGGGGSTYGGGSGGGGVVVTKPEDRFGTGFGALFRAAANSDPSEPAAGFIIPVDVTTDPLSVD